MVDVTGEKTESAIPGKVGENVANLPEKGLLAGHAHLGEGRNVAVTTVVNPHAVDGTIGDQALLRESIEAEGIVTRREGKGGVARLAENEGHLAE